MVLQMSLNEKGNFTGRLFFFKFNFLQSHGELCLLRHWNVSVISTGKDKIRNILIQCSGDYVFLIVKGNDSFSSENLSI